MRKILVLLCFAAFAGSAMAQTYTEGNGISGVDKLGAHQNGGRGCVGCHAPHSGARGNGGNAAAGGDVTDPDAGNFALWGEDLGPLYGQTLLFGDEGEFDITLPASMGVTGADEQVLTGVAMCLSCHDGNIAKGAMMTNQSYEQARGLLPATYGSGTIPTLLGSDGTANGNYMNDHPIGPKARLGALGSTGIVSKLVYSTCGTAPDTYACLIPDNTKADFWAFYLHYGAFNITSRVSGSYESGGRASPLVLPDSDKNNAYVVCTTCHTPHSMYTFSGRVKNQSAQGTYPTYFFIAAPYNPGAPVTNPTTASSATQFCRQCHFTGAGGSNEGSGIMNVTTQF